MFETEQQPIARRLLIVEPHDGTRRTLLDFLSPNYECDEAASAGTAFEKIAAAEFGVVISNFDLPETSGLELLSSIRFLAPGTSVILTGENKSAEEVIGAFRAGAFDFLQKPFKLREIADTVEKAFERFKAQRLRENYGRHLEKMVADRNESLDKALGNIENSYRTTLKALVQALEARDFETHGHSERVVTFSLRLAYELGLEREKMRDLELGALLHDIGKIGVPDSILRKPAKLTEREWERMKLHPMLGAKILRNIPFLEGAAKVVAQHHERWDGQGYPNGLRGEKIEIIARIFAVADAFDAMISDRIYRKGRSYEDAIAELDKHAGTQFDPLIIEAFRVVPKEDWETLRLRSLKEKTEVFSFQEIVAELVKAQNRFEMVH
jgi:putative nucleotidyltransferase with HDIG domain